MLREREDKKTATELPGKSHLISTVTRAEEEVDQEVLPDSGHFRTIHHLNIHQDFTVSY